MSNLIDVVDGINKLSVSLNAACLLSSGTEQEREVSYSLLLISAELASSLAKEDFYPRRQSSTAQPRNPLTTLTINSRLQLARENLGLTEADVARELGIYSDHISDWECGITELPAGMVIPLANALKCDPLWLLSGEPSAIAEES